MTTTIHFVSLAILASVFLVSTGAIVLISHYVDNNDKRPVMPMLVCHLFLVMLAVVVFSYDISDFDQGKIDWYAPLVFAGFYMVFSIVSIQQVLQPRPASIGRLAG